MLGLSPNGSRQCADTYASFASLPLPLNTPVTEGFTFAAGPNFLAVDAGSESQPLSSATSKRALKLLGIIESVSVGCVALQITRPFCTLRFSGAWSLWALGVTCLVRSVTCSYPSPASPRPPCLFLPAQEASPRP